MLSQSSRGAILDDSIQEGRIGALETPIRELRWMGLEQEAVRVAESLGKLTPHAIMSLGPIETD